MHEAQVEKIIKKAVQRERRLWLSLFAFAFIFTLNRTPVQVLDSERAFQRTGTLPVNRRMLQATSKAEITVAAPSPELSELAIPPAEEDLSSLPQSLALTPSPETELLDLALSPAIEAPLSLSNSSETVLQECNCPPGPKGDSAPEFLNNIFSFDQARGILKIDATTIELTGNLVINGFTGVKQSLFIGGDPSNGSPSTEVAAGKLLVYGAGDQGPSITAFSAGENGFAISRLTVQGQLFEDPAGLGQPKRVSTGLF
ncbi:hypothetical protein Ndes2526B_g03303 [Nannochloris sp. 'desiccata']